MSCAFCIHWIADKRAEQWSFEKWVEETGECALHPQRQKTTADYYCSQLRLKQPGIVIVFRKRMEDYGDTIDKLNDKIRKLEARKKILNKKVTELRAQIKKPAPG